MPVIWIPSLLRDLTAGQERVTVSGTTLRQALDELEARYPGIKARLIWQDQLRPDISAVVDGTVSHLKLRQPLFEDSEVHLLPAFDGG
jgi:molybdopterin synthase sulfur carrier subunit